MTQTSNATEEKRQHHIKEMREKLERLTGQPPSLFMAVDGNSELEEKFLEHILAFEGADEVPLFDALEKGGIALPPANNLDDAQLTAKLWEVIRGMALLGHYLDHTDHLSDRQLYELLWSDTLREPTSISDNPSFACHIDVLGGWSEEDMQIFLKYYADEDDRRDWSESCDDLSLPEHEDPPYDRDRHLPGPRFEATDSDE